MNVKSKKDKNIMIAKSLKYEVRSTDERNLLTSGKKIGTEPLFNLTQMLSKKRLKEC